ncbi:pancreatic triacylglycerol lipase-like [Melanaphis sacchari]|uniref:pancreatic triacylglycerol lipase-like n=1 Tax=Melanaphis sacchari TaxID=742174 RepID=UPI000DC150F1|nr:pancreatic triacylglycerol lipase-like [Melanaphis sacchari]
MSIFLTILVLCMAYIHSVTNLSVWDFLTNPDSTKEEDLTLIQTMDKDGLQFFYLNEKLGHDKRIQMDLNNVSAIVNYWMKGLPLKVTVHGWHGSENAIYGVYEINDAYIGLGGYNIITVDWSSFASNSEYAYSAALALTVGTGVAVFLENVVNLTGILPADIHLIGYNLGAHVVGRCAYRFGMWKFGRLTGLDPIKILRNNKDMNVTAFNIDYAKFVDVIHTSGGKFGDMNNLGHTDFYPNSGEVSQPGCYDSLLPSLELQKCSQQRAYEYYRDSVIHNNSFIAVYCGSWEFYALHRCDDPIFLRIPMGHSAKPSPFTMGAYYMYTNDKSPFHGE